MLRMANLIEESGRIKRAADDLDYQLDPTLDFSDAMEPQVIALCDDIQRSLDAIRQAIRDGALRR